MLQARAMTIGPNGSLYQHGFLFFNINFPKNYPYAPPDVSYISRNKVRIHPNLYVGRHSEDMVKYVFLYWEHGVDPNGQVLWI